MSVNVETMFENSEEEIDIVTVDPSDERIINFDELIRELPDCVEDSDNHTDIESDTEDVIIDVVNTSTISAEDSKSRLPTLQDASKSLDEIFDKDVLSSISQKRKRQDSDEIASETCLKRNKTNAEFTEPNNLLNHSMSESCKTVAIRQKQWKSPSSIKISSKSPKHERISTSEDCADYLNCTVENSNLSTMKIILQKVNADAYTGHHGNMSVEDASDISNCSFEPRVKSQNLSEINKSGEANYSQKNVELKSFVLTCTKCNMKTKASDKFDKCPKCMSDLAFSCEKSPEQLSSQQKNCGSCFYNCEDCNSKFRTKRALSNHIQNVHRKSKPHQCPICYGIYKNKESLRVHKMFCNKHPHFRCCFCSFASKRSWSVKNHLKRVHKDRFDTIEKYEAIYEKIKKNGISMREKEVKSSSARTPANTALTSSAETIKSSSARTPANSATSSAETMKSSSARTPANSALTSSVETQDDTRFHLASKTSYYCPQCKEVVKVTGRCNNKKCLVCKSPTLFQCNKCAKQYEAYTSLVTHVKTVCYPKEILSCDHCCFTTYFRYRLQNHIKKHH